MKATRAEEVSICPCAVRDPAQKHHAPQPGRSGTLSQGTGLADSECRVEPSFSQDRLIEFGCYAGQNRKRKGEGNPETLDFFGFTLMCAVTELAGDAAVITSGDHRCSMMIGAAVSFNAACPVKKPSASWRFNRSLETPSGVAIRNTSAARSCTLCMPDAAISLSNWRILPAVSSSDWKSPYYCIERVFPARMCIHLKGEDIQRQSLVHWKASKESKTK